MCHAAVDFGRTKHSTSEAGYEGGRGIPLKPMASVAAGPSLPKWNRIVPLHQPTSSLLLSLWTFPLFATGCSPGLKRCNFFSFFSCPPLSSPSFLNVCFSALTVAKLSSASKGLAWETWSRVIKRYSWGCLLVAPLLRFSVRVGTLH